MNRREFLTTAITLASAPLFANYDAFYSGKRTLWLSRNGQTIQRVFYADGRLLRGAYEDLCYFLKDEKANIAVEMDIELLSGASFIQKFLIQNGINSPININSGYRTPKTNANTEGAVRDSYHVRASALDINNPHVSNQTLAAIAERVGFGGIGLYKTFIHLDTGRYRRWVA